MFNNFIVCSFFKKLQKKERSQKQVELIWIKFYVKLLTLGLQSK